MTSSNCITGTSEGSPLKWLKAGSIATTGPVDASFAPNPGMRAVAGRRPPTRGLGHALQTLAIICVLSLAAYFLFSRFVVMTVVVQGRSMAPTLRDGDRLVLNRAAFLMHSPARGDLVVLQDPGHDDYAVKRVVGLPGDSLRFANGTVYLNGQKLREQYLGMGLPTFMPDLQEKQVTLGADEYFVLGDNRPNSEDSRYYGPIRRSAILGQIRL